MENQTEKTYSLPLTREADLFTGFRLDYSEWLNSDEGSSLEGWLRYHFDAQPLESWGLSAEEISVFFHWKGALDKEPSLILEWMAGYYSPDAVRTADLYLRNRMLRGSADQTAYAVAIVLSSQMYDGIPWSSWDEKFRHFCRKIESQYRIF